jgi:tubulin polyglutamylase TTLL1
MDRPFLYNKRKFDIRCYMMICQVNGIFRAYWYNEGYIRTSGSVFNL